VNSEIDSENVKTVCWVVVPVFYDVPSFFKLHNELSRISKLADGGQEVFIKILMVDDSAGADPEVDLVRELEDVTVIVPPFNLGHQRAIVYGLRSLEEILGDEEVVVTMDGDGEDRPEDVSRLISRLLSLSSNSVVFAERTNRTESVKFRMFYRLFKLMFRAMTGISIRTGNFAAQWGSFVRKTIFHPSFDLCYSTTLLSLRRPMELVPCSRGQRYEGRSKMSMHRLVAHGIRMLLPFAERIAVRMLVFSLSVLVFGAISFLLLLIFYVMGVFYPSMLFVSLTFVLGGFVTLGAFLALFAGFAQSSAIALKGLDSSGTRQF